MCGCVNGCVNGLVSARVCVRGGGVGLEKTKKEHYDKTVQISTIAIQIQYIVHTVFLSI